MPIASCTVIPASCGLDWDGHFLLKAFPFSYLKIMGDVCHIHMVHPDIVSPVSLHIHFELMQCPL